MDKDIFLDANAKTLPCNAAQHVENDETMVPSSLERIYDLVGASLEDTFVYTSSNAEAVNQVLWSVFLEISRKTGKCHFITSAIEDAPTMQMMKRLEDLGCFVKIAPVNLKGEIDIEQLKALINPRTALISITMANGLTGVIQPIEEIEKIAHEKGILLHLDGSSAIGKYAFSFAETKAHYLTFSGNLIHSLPATGGLFAKKDAPLVPLILGGSNLRAGPQDTPSILSLCAAATQASLFLDMMSLEVARLRDLFEKEILKLIPDAQILFKNTLRLPNTTVIAFPFAHQEALLHMLRRKNVEALIGGNYSQHLFHLLTASKIDPLTASCSLSFSLSRMTTEESLRKAATLIYESVDFLRSAALPSMISTETTAYSSSVSPFSKKLREKINAPRYIGSFTQAQGMRYVTAQEKGIAFHFLIDESDGIIADAKFQFFGPIALLGIGEIVSELVMRKNHKQASRLTADLIDAHVRDKKDSPAFPKESHALINQAISAIDTATQSCTDIPCESADYDITPIEWDFNENPNGLPGWDEFSLEKKIYLIEEVIDKEIRPYVELDAGGVKVVELKENHELVISYQGSCTTCHSATGSTLTAIQQILRSRIHPKLFVTPQL